MKTITYLLTILWVITIPFTVFGQQEERLRVMVLTDIENEPDDAQ